MKKAFFKSKKLLILSLILVIPLLAVGFTVSSFAADSSNDYWTFSSDSVKDPMYISKHFTSLPRAFEAEVNIPETLEGTSPIIANWTQSNTRDSFGFQLSASGTPTIYYKQNHYELSGEKPATVTTEYRANFTYKIPRNEWVRLAVVNEIDTGVAVYKLYVNGQLQETITKTTPEGIADFDAVYSQSAMRELSIGNDGRYHFQGKLRNVAVYENALTEAEAAKTAKENKYDGDTNLLAYYDATMSGNADKLFKDQTGNGHDAKSAFFERPEPVKEYAYSFAFVGDTQFLVERDVDNNTTEYASPIFDWIIANKDKKKIQHMFGLGDITDNNSDPEWKYAVTLYEKLGNAGVNYSLVSGNHDDYTTPAARYNQYFGKVNSFVDSVTGFYEEGHIENFYTNFDVGNHKYMVIGLLYGANDKVLKWADEVVSANSDRKVIVITHSLFNAAGEWAQPDTSAQTTTNPANKGIMNNGIDIWNKFISQHSNIIIAAAGHISADVIKAGKSIGVNGNVVNTFLINPQGFDMATGYDTGMVAMFYFSEDGNDVQVEYVSTTKTLRAQQTNPDAKDILYHEKNQFSFKVNEVGESYTYSQYGAIPNENIIGNNFAVFSGGKFISAHPTWNAATNAVASLFDANRYADVQILLLNDYNNAGDAVVNTALSQAYGTLTIDLGGKTFFRGAKGNLLNLEVEDDVSNTEPSNIFVKNGSIRTLGRAIISSQITNKAYKAEKTWNLTFEKVTLGYAETLSATKEVFYTAWTNSASADESQLGTKTNLIFNNCTFDLKTNDPETLVTHFKMKDDHTGVDKIDVTLKINGGKILADIDDLKIVEKADETKDGIVLYTVNEGSDSVIFGEYNGEYTKLETHTTAKDYEHYTGAFPAADGNRYFVEISDDGEKSVYELKIVVPTGVNATLNASNDAKYLSAVDYTFLVFDKAGNLKHATNTLYGTNGAMYYAVQSGFTTANDTVYIVMLGDYTMKSTEKSSELSLSKVEGNLIIELGGNSLIADANTGSKNYIFDSYAASASSNAAYFTIQNGSVRTYNTPIVRFYAENASIDVSNKLMSWTFDNVTLGLVSGSTYDRFFNIAFSEVKYNGNEKTPVAPAMLNFNDCTIDLETVKPSGNFYVFRTNFADGTHIKGDVRVNGGKIIAQDLANIRFDNLDTFYGSTLYLGKGSDGEYIKVVIPAGKDFGFVINEKTGEFGPITKKTESGADVSFILLETVGSKKIYGAGVDSDYGVVPPEYGSEEEYPWFVFDNEGNFRGAYGTLLGGEGTALYDAINTVLNSNKGSTVSIVLRTDYIIGASETYGGDLEAANGRVIIDLGGNTLSEDTARAKDKYWFSSWVSSTTHASYFTFKNGTIKTYSNAILCFCSNGAADDKLMSWTFDNVIFGLIEGNTYDRFFHILNAKNSGKTISAALIFNDCTFDLNSVKPNSSEFYVFRTNFTSSTKINADIKVNGGKILTDNPTSTKNKIYLDNFSGAAGCTMYFGAGSDGEFLKIVLPKNQDFGIYVNDLANKINALYNLSNNITKYTENGTKIKFYKESSSDTEDVYSFCFDTKYGTVPAKYEDVNAYPFFIFNSRGIFDSATDKWALDNSPSALSSSKTKGYVVLLRRNYTNSDGQYNNLSHTQDLTVDLGGFTLTNSGCTLFMAQKKPEGNTTERHSKITLINGTVILGFRPLVKMDTSTKTTSNTYGFTFVFENLTIKMNNHKDNDKFICMDEFVEGDPVQYCNFTFNNCVFDLSNANKAMTLFDVSDSRCKVTAVMNGGKIITSAYGVTLWKNYETDPSTVTAHTESTLTFTMNEGGEYSELYIPIGAALPVQSVNGGTLCYVKTAENDGYAVYKLVSSKVTEFVPKTSITLGSELIYNVYVPQDDSLKSFTVDGETYENLTPVTLDDGKQYYLISVALESSKAARSIVLQVTLTVDGKDYTGTFTMSIPKYAKKILASNANKEETTLVKDVLAYIRSAYTFFNGTTVPEIDEILGTYESTTVINTADAEKTATGLSGATFVLGARPAVRFYFSGAYAYNLFSFKVGERALKITEDNYNASENYVEFSLYAYEMTEVFSYTVANTEVAGKYNLISYYAYASGSGENDYKGADKEALTDVTAKFYNYCVSAAAYRNSVINK